MIDVEETNDLLSGWRLLRDRNLEHVECDDTEDAAHLEAALGQCLEAVFESDANIVESIEYLKYVISQHFEMHRNVFETEEFCDLIVSTLLNPSPLIKRATLALIDELTEKSFPGILLNAATVNAILNCAKQDASVFEVLLKMFTGSEVPFWADYFSRVCETCLHCHYFSQRLVKLMTEVVKYDQSCILTNCDLIYPTVSLSFANNFIEDVIELLVVIVDHRYSEFAQILERERQMLFSLFAMKTCSSLRLLQSLVKQNYLVSCEELLCIYDSTFDLIHSPNQELKKQAWKLSDLLVERQDGAARFYLENGVVNECFDVFKSDLSFHIKICAVTTCFRAILQCSDMLSANDKEMISSIVFEVGDSDICDEDCDLHKMISAIVSSDILI